jgi:hypothetical protein
LKDVLGSVGKLPRAQLDQFTALWSVEAWTISKQFKHSDVHEVASVFFQLKSTGLLE